VVRVRTNPSSATRALAARRKDLEAIAELEAIREEREKTGLR
jgi:hypothetical protein